MHTTCWLYDWSSFFLSHQISFPLFLSAVLYSSFEPFNGSLFFPIQSFNRSIVRVVCSCFFLCFLVTIRFISRRFFAFFFSCWESSLFSNLEYVCLWFMFSVTHSMTVRFERCTVFSRVVFIIVFVVDSDSKLKSSIYYHTGIQLVNPHLMCVYVLFYWSS